MTKKFDHTNEEHIIKIIEGCERGDRRIQNQLFKMMYGKMMAVAMRYSDNNESANDIMSNSFIKVFEKIKTVNVEKRNIEGWIRSIVVNSAIDYFRRNKKNNIVDSIDDELKFIQVPSREEEFEIGDVTGEYIIKMIQELPNSYKAVFNLYVMEGKPHKEIAEILGISEGTSKSNYFKAKKNLQKKINNRKLNEDNRILNLEENYEELELDVEEACK